MRRFSGYLFPLLAALVFFAGCGYGFAPSPYRLNVPAEGISLYIPVAENRSRYASLGPELTRSVVELLSGTPGVRLVSEGADATLKLSIVSVVLGSASWELVPSSSSEVPEASASRTASVNVEAVFTRKNPRDGLPKSKRQVFSSSRTFVVSNIQGQVEMQEAQALSRVVDDITRKIAMIMFTEF
ncbi:MAG: LPS assembly lipoprotein LptE [Deltaproteobacteria bacterium]|nr:LPS assembly lipoprotein LptE [Deltaproteobacteria bacterium]